MDRAYTGYDAVTRCGTEFQMTCLGTVQASRKGLPKEFTSTEGRPVGDLKVLYDVNSKISIHSEICGVKSGPPKNVMLMTSMVLDLARSRDDTRRLYLTCLYNYTMGGTDRVDQLIGNMSCRWKSDRWTMNTFAFMLDTARVNSRTVALLQDGRDVPTSRKYGFDLVRDLVTPHILSRMASPGIQNFVKLSAKVYLASGGVGIKNARRLLRLLTPPSPMWRHSLTRWPSLERQPSLMRLPSLERQSSLMRLPSLLGLHCLVWLPSLLLKVILSRQTRWAHYNYDCIRRFQATKGGALVDD